MTDATYTAVVDASSSMAMAEAVADEDDNDATTMMGEKQKEEDKSSVVVAVPPPPPPPRQFLPCIEQPNRCYFSSIARDKRLSTSKDGRVFLSTKRSNQECFVLIPQQENGNNNNAIFFIQSFKHQRFLKCGGDGVVVVQPESSNDDDDDDEQEGEIVFENKQSTLSSSSSNEDIIPITSTSTNRKKDNDGGLWHRAPKVLASQKEAESEKVETSFWSRASQTLTSSRRLVKSDHQKEGSAATNYENKDDNDNKEESNLWTRASKLLAERRAASMRRSMEADVVFTTDNTDDASLWCLERTPDGGGFYVTCADDNDDGKYLAYDDDDVDGGTIALTTTEKKEHAAIWNLEFQTGELCFISSPGMDRRVRCDLVGSLSLSENWKGWEVWRFIEADGEGLVRISAWMHHNHYLSSKADGSVSTTTTPQTDDCTLWAVEQDTEGVGVIIRSAAHDKVLCCDNEALFTDPYGGAFGVWQLDAAHRQMYSLCTVVENMSVGPFPYVTNNKRQLDEWEVEKRGDTMTFYSPEKRQFLGSTCDGDICLTPIDQLEERESWLMEPLPDGGYAFRSTKHGRFLSWTESGEKDGSLCTVPERDGERATWRLDPCMPRAVSGDKIKTFAVGTTAAVATTVAMPFVTAGVIGLIGAEVGILADIVIVGLTGAEAVASVGVVGTTAALVFKESGDSFGSEHGKSIEEDNVKSYAKRPFAAIGCGKDIKVPEFL